jgi:HD-GYP domain-containing protein (c-di-GMP phosphodiesterase class II)
MTEGTGTLNMDSQKDLDQPDENFLRTFYWLLQTVKIHKDNNKVLRECATEFVNAVIHLCADEQYLTVQVYGGRFYLWDKKVLYRMENIDLIHAMLHFFESRGLQGLRFYATLNDFPIEQVLAFARILNQAERQDSPVAWIGQQLEGNAFPWAEIVHGAEVSQKEDLELKQRARQTYFYSLASIKEIGQKISSRRPLGIRKAKRMVQNLVDLLSEDESLLLSISTIRDYDDYTYTHSVNVAILCLCLGKRLGLSRTALERLGICGLFHDLGKIEISREILLKPGRLNDQEFEEIRKHPLKSVSYIVKLPTDGDLKAWIIPPIFEHHLKYDLSGYPRPHREKPQGLFGRILSIADVFDAMTSPRIYRLKPCSPNQALGLMMEGAGKDFDPILLKVFVNMLGVFPIGTLLELNTGEIGLVIETPGETRKERPRILILEADGKGGFRKGKAASLAERDPNTGLFKRNIVKALHPTSYGIQPAEFLL